jgi:hypothetical protein
MRKSVLAAVKASKNDCGCKPEKSGDAKALKTSAVTEEAPGEEQAKVVRSEQAEKVALKGAPTLRLVQ